MESPQQLMFNLKALTSSEAKRQFKESIFERDGHCCVYCGCNHNLTLDHITPKFSGGTYTADNLVTACRPCNQKKGTTHVSLFMEKYDLHSFRPNYIPA
jgi:5-methylcytosine-specific restriction endonuclease McrA